ncbi:MAG: hypothetical protein KAQ68_04185, partial [Clostridiales bacterium]|nr:hypothetical protein [Clostridiales bacterium]
VETATKLVYSLVDGKYFRLTSYSEPAEYNENLPASLESRIRAIFPFEFMKKIMIALDDTDVVRRDIHRQALDYLRISGQGELEIDD